MARSTSVIGVSHTLVEGFSAEGGEGTPQPARAVFAPQEGGNGGPPLLQAFLESANWPAAMAVVVLPTDAATFRRLKFPFNEPRRIRQVIRFELESEVLEDVADYVIDQEIVPLAEGGAEARTYLVDSKQIQEAVGACRAAGQQPFRVTLSAHALLAAHPPDGPHAIQVYAGAEESFVSLIRDGRVEAVRSIANGLPGLVSELQRQGIVSAREIRWILQGESDSEKINRGLLRSRMMSELTGLAEELNLFLRVHDQGESCPVAFFGLFGGFLRMGEAERIEAVEAPPKGMRTAERHYLGIVDELQTNPAALRAREGLNFHAAGFGLRGQMAELRRPLIAAAVLLGVVLLLSGTQYVLRTAQLWRERSALEAQISAVIRKNIASNPPIITGVPILRERLQKARDEARGTARFTNYQYDALTMLSQVSSAVGAASGITVESLSFGKDRLSMVGTTPSFQASEDLKNRLGALAVFKGKEPKLTHQRTGQTINFRLTIE